MPLCISPSITLVCYRRMEINIPVMHKIYAAASYYLVKVMSKAKPMTAFQLSNSAVLSPNVI